jgi:hypothetical protein
MSARWNIVVLGAALALVVPGARTASAGFGSFSDLGGGAQIQYELSSVHDIDHDAMSAPRSNDLVLGGFRTHGFVGGKRWGYHVGAAVLAGSTIRDAGFAYDVSLFPIGIALRFFETSFITLGAGIGASGAVGTLDDALTFPLEARFEVGRGIRVLGRARVTYLDNAPGRENGGVSLDLGDELEAMLAVRLGKGYDEHSFPTGNGYFIGMTVREALGARFAGLVIGYSVDMGTRRTPRHYTSYDGCRDCD